LDGTWSNEAASPAANDHSNTSINEPGTKMRARTGTVSVPAKFMLQRIAQESAETARLLPRRQERIGRRTLISAVRRHQRKSTAAERAEKNMSERNKICKANNKTRQPGHCRPLRPERSHEIRLGFDDESIRQI
jgi:hypothetical protein